MKKEKISETIDNINTKYIDEATAYTRAVKNKPKKLWYKWAAVAACFVLVLTIGVWQSVLLMTTPPDISDDDNSGLQGTDKINETSSGSNESVGIAPDTSVIWGSSYDASMDMGYIEWNGKRITLSLYDAVSDEKAKNSLIAVGVGFEQNDSFVYKGRSLAEYSAEAENEHLLCNKLGELLKSGDSLKYGDALYKTGTPAGEKWAKELYEETVERLGADLLAKYIVDGEFLKEKLESDIEECAEYRPCRVAYEEACKAYCRSAVDAAIEQAENKNIRHEIRNGTEPVLYVTADELSSLDIDNVLFYCLALKDGEATDLTNS